MIREKLWTLDEVREHLQIGKSKVHELLRTGRLRSLKVGRLRRVAESDLADFLEQCRDGGDED